MALQQPNPPCGDDLALLLSKIVLHLPYDASAVDPEFASYLRENALTCVVVGKWQTSNLEQLKNHSLAAKAAGLATRTSAGGGIDRNNPFARAGQKAGNADSTPAASEGGVAYYCSRVQSRSFGLSMVAVKQISGSKTATSKTEEPAYLERKRLQVLRLAWEDGFPLDLREIGVNPYTKTVSFTLRDQAPLSRGAFPEHELKRAVRASAREERVARNERGNETADQAYEILPPKRVAPRRFSTSSSAGGGAEGRLEVDGRKNRVQLQTESTSSALEGHLVHSDVDVHLPGLNSTAFQQLAFPERGALFLEFYIFRPSNKQQVLGATGVSGDVIYHFNYTLDLFNLRRRSRQKLPGELGTVKNPPLAKAPRATFLDYGEENHGDELCSSRPQLFVQDCFRVEEAQTARWKAKPYLRPYCEVELESADHSFQAPRQGQEKGPSVAASSSSSSQAGRRGDKKRVTTGTPGRTATNPARRPSAGNSNELKVPDDDDDQDLSHYPSNSRKPALMRSSRTSAARTSRQALVKLARKTGSTADTVRKKPSGRPITASTGRHHKCFRMAWALGRPRGLSYHFGNSRSFQKMRFWDLVRLKTIQKTRLQQESRGGGGAPGIIATAGAGNGSRRRSGRRRRSGDESERRSQNNAEERRHHNENENDFFPYYAHRRHREEMDANAVEKLPYDANHPYQNSDVYESADQVKKYYYRAGWNNHLLNPNWFSAFQKEDWREREFFVQNAALADLDPFDGEQESEPDSVFDADDRLRELDDELAHLAQESEDDEPLPPPFQVREDRAKTATRNYLKPFFWWAVHRALDMEAAQVVVQSCVELVRDQVVAEEEADLATAVLDAVADKVARNVLDLEHGTVADALVQHAVDRAGDPTSGGHDFASTDQILQTVYGNAVHTLSNEHKVIARRTLHRIYDTVVDTLQLNEEQEFDGGQKEQSEPNGGHRKEDLLFPSTWGNHKTLGGADGDSIYSIDTSDHQSICVVGDPGRPKLKSEFGPFTIGCKGVRVVRHYFSMAAGDRDSNSSCVAQEDGEEEEDTDLFLSEDQLLDRKYEAQRRRQQRRRDRRSEISDEREVRKQVMRNAKKFRRELQKRLQFLGDAHGLELRSFEHDIFASEYGVLNPHRQRRGPSVKELVWSQAVRRASSAGAGTGGRRVRTNYPDDEPQDEGRIVDGQKNYRATNDRGEGKHGARAPPRHGAGNKPEVRNKSGLQDEVSPVDVQGPIYVTHAADAVPHEQEEKQGKRGSKRVNKPPRSAGPAGRYDEDTGRPRSFSSCYDLVVQQHRVRAADAEGRQGPAGIAATRGGPTRNFQPGLAFNPDEFRILRAGRDQLKMYREEEEQAKERAKNLCRSAASKKAAGGRKTASSYYDDRKTYQWDAPVDVFGREKAEILAQYKENEKAKTRSAGGRAGGSAVASGSAWKLDLGEVDWMAALQM
ncbi:unnamed protein product [Amoebophrya sp. A120]|nr:unnamed protein product [Amoebophrya sp. A120]|eukprot:GSA120T00025362001.1